MKNKQVFYTVDKPSKNWKGGVGYVSKDVVTKGLPGPGENTLILVRENIRSRFYANPQSGFQSF